MKTGLRVVFMGTPDFAVPALESLHQSRHEIVLVVTQPDRPRGRGRKMMPPPVKAAATRMGYNTIQPESISGIGFADQITKLQPDLIAVVAFGSILKPRILNIPRCGAVNIHASLLPKYRGPAPIQWAIINGESETGVTVIQMDEKMDTGDILLSEKIGIEPDETAATLHDRLSELGGGLLVRVMDQISNQTMVSTPQDHSGATYCKLLKKQDGRIDWHLPAERIEAFIRGMSPWPGAYTFYGNRRLKIFKSLVVPLTERDAPGCIVRSFTGEMRVATGSGALSILEIQSGSGKRLEIQEFLRGNPIPVGRSFQ